MMKDMQAIGLWANSLTVFSDLREDPVVRGLLQVFSAKRFEKAVSGYAQVCHALASSGLSLSEYLFRQASYCDNPLMRDAAGGKTPDRLLEACGRHDAEVLCLLAETDSALLKEALQDREKKNTRLIASLPDFSAGELEITLEGLLRRAKERGVGLFARYHAFSFDRQKGLLPIQRHDPVRLSQLKNYELQRQKIVENTLCFLQGQPASNALLYGDRGTGKSSTVKALLNEYHARGLRLVQTDKKSLEGLGELIEQLQQFPHRFIIFLDDLTFSEEDRDLGALKAALEGSLVSRPDNVLIYATSNRRHLVKETFSSRSGDEIHRGDTIHETMSLSDRFGLSVTFSCPGRQEFADIVLAMAKERQLEVEEEALLAGAERFALKKGGRSPRLAKQYVDQLQARLALGLEIFG